MDRTRHRHEGSHKRRRSPSPRAYRRDRNDDFRHSSLRNSYHDSHTSYEDDRRKRRRSRSPPLSLHIRNHSPARHEQDLSKYDLGDIYAYTYKKAIAEGTFGSVFLATNKKSSLVAVKKLRLTPAMKANKVYQREIDILLECHHKNIVRLHELATNSKGDLFLIFDYIEFDLKQLLVNCPQQLSDCAVMKHLLSQLLHGLDYLHSKNLIHRDIKPRNLLVDNTGRLEIADLGSARRLSRSSGNMSPGVVTLRYRAPEILLKDIYGLSADCWSVGCIFAELHTGRPLFPATNEIELLEHFCETLGTPSEVTWPGCSRLPGIKNLKSPTQPNRLREKYPSLSEAGFDLLSKFLTYNPALRITVEAAKEHPFFKETPLPVKSFKPACEDIVAESTTKESPSKA